MTVNRKFKVDSENFIPQLSSKKGEEFCRKLEYQLHQKVEFDEKIKYDELDVNVIECKLTNISYSSSYDFNKKKEPENVSSSIFKIEGSFLLDIYLNERCLDTDVSIEVILNVQNKFDPITDPLKDSTASSLMDIQFVFESARIKDDIFDANFTKTEKLKDTSLLGNFLTELFSAFLLLLKDKSHPYFSNYKYARAIYNSRFLQNLFSPELLLNVHNTINQQIIQNNFRDYTGSDKKNDEKNKTTAEGLEQSLSSIVLPNKENILSVNLDDSFRISFK